MAKIRKGLICFMVLILLLTASISQDFNMMTANAQEGVDEYVFRRSWGMEGDSFLRDYGIAIDPDGRIILLNKYYVAIYDPRERILNNFGEPGSGPGQFSNPCSVSVDSTGSIFVADCGNSRIQKFTSNGFFITQWGSYGSEPGLFDGIGRTAIDTYGNIYVSDKGNNRIQKFSSNGVFITEWGSYGNKPGQFSTPRGIAVDGNNYVYVADYEIDRIQKFTSNGVFVNQWEVGTGVGEFGVCLCEIAADDIGNVYITDYDNNHVRKFTSNGVLITQWGSWDYSDPNQFYYPDGIALDSIGNVYVSGSGIFKFTSNGEYITQYGTNDDGIGQAIPGYGLAVGINGFVYVTDYYHIQKFTHDGAYVSQWGSDGSEPGQFDFATGIAVDKDGFVYITDQHNNRIQKFTSNGAYITNWGSYGSAIGQFSYPEGIYVDKDGFVYVADTGNHRIQKFTSNGGYITQWGSYGSEPGQFIFPKGIVVDRNGNVYVTNSECNDGENIHIQKFTSNGVYLTQWGSYACINHYDCPLLIALDGDSNILVSDYYNYRIQKFTSDGVLITQWGTYGIKAGQFLAPEHLSSDTFGNIYVYDSGRIQIFTPGLPDPDSYSGLVLNGTFESSTYLAEWTYGGDLPVSRSTHAAQGSYALQLGVPVVQTEQGLGDAWAHSTFYVRPEWDRPTLSFKYNMFVNDIMDYSDFFVAIQDGVGLNHLATIVRDGFQPCIPGVAPSPGRDLGWRSVTYDLSAYKGQHIRLVFSNRNLWPGSWGIWTYVDDVRVIDAGPLPPMLGPYFSFLPLINNYRCDPVTFSGLNTYDKSIFRENLND